MALKYKSGPSLEIGMAESGQVCISANPDGVTIRQLGSRFWFVARVVRRIVFMVTSWTNPSPTSSPLFCLLKGTRRFAMTRSSSGVAVAKLQIRK